MKKMIALVATLVMVLICTLAVAETKIVVNGTGEVRVSADTAVISLGVNARDKDVLKAYDFAGKSSLLVGVRVNKNTSLIGEYGEGINELNRYNAYSVIWNNPIFRQITPDTDYVIEDCAYNNNQIAFTAHRGDSRYLFIIDDKEDSEPQTVTSLDNKYTLFFWS